MGDSEFLIIKSVTEYISKCHILDGRQLLRREHVIILIPMLVTQLQCNELIHNTTHCSWPYNSTGNRLLHKHTDIEINLIFPIVEIDNFIPRRSHLGFTVSLK